MSIQFSGLGSGLPIDDWIKALVKTKQDKIDTLTEKQKTLQTKSTNLDSLKSLYSSLDTAATKWMDSLLGPSSDIFSSVKVSSSEDSKGEDAAKSILASVTNLATPAEIDIEVKSLATKTKTSSDTNEAWKNSASKLSDLGISGDSTLTINGTDIAVNENMTVADLVYQIGNSSAGVNAYLKGGTLVLENKATGQSDIDISGDFAQATGLDKASNIQMGTNAVYTINGDEKTSSTNSLDSTDTGIVGLSLELKEVTTNPVTIKIDRNYDSSGVESALDEFITAFNDVISQTDKQTKVGGLLNGENQLTGIRNSLRTTITAALGNDNILKSLADIGITTGAVGADINADTTQLVFDKEKFREAFEKDPAAVKALLVGDQSKGTTGIMQNVQTALKPALDSSSGYFKARSESLNNELTSMSSTIERKNEELELYEAKLQKQYTYMDLQIAKLNQQFTQMKQQLAALFPTDE